MNEQNFIPSRPAKAHGGRSGVGTGTISLLMIFTVLCFATLAMLSLSTAAANASMQDKGVRRGVAAAQADAEAAAATAQLDAGLLALHRGNAGGTAAFYEKAVDLALGLGWETDAEAHIVTLCLPVTVTEADGRQTAAYEFVTRLELLPPGSAGRYAVLEQTTRPLDGGQTGGGQLWVPA